jgi:hypothetical protein
MTKLDLLCALEVGYELRPSPTFMPLSLPIIDPPPSATTTIPYSVTFTAFGGIPSYDWDITSGALPPGLALDSFTCTVAGTPTTNGTFTFGLRVRDYHEGTDGITRNVTLNVLPAQPLYLALSIVGQGTKSQAQLVVNRTTGQREVIQVSTNLVAWTGCQ